MNKFLRVLVVFFFVMLAYVMGVCSKAWLFMEGLNPQIGFTKISFSVSGSVADVEPLVNNALGEDYDKGVHVIFSYPEGHTCGHLLVIDEYGKYFRARSEIEELVVGVLKQSPSIGSISIKRRDPSIRFQNGTGGPYGNSSEEE